MKGRRAGFTLVEMAVVVAIVSLVALVAGMGVGQVVKSTGRNNDQMTALRQVQAAGYWVGRDAMMARDIAVGDDLGTPEMEFVSFNWVEWEDGHEHALTYSLEDTADGLKRVLRRHVVRDAEGVLLEDSVMLVAQYVYGSPQFVEQGGAWTLSVAARAGGQIEARQYQARPRVNI